MSLHKSGIRNNFPHRSGRISTIKMVWARRANKGKEMPQNGLASQNTGEETQRKTPTHLGRSREDLTERGTEWNGVRTIARRSL